MVGDGDFVGRVMLEGRGAGAGPTASAVVADLIDIARARQTPVWGAAAAELSAAPSVPMSEHFGPYYIRLMVVDRPGVIADRHRRRLRDPAFPGVDATTRPQPR